MTEEKLKKVLVGLGVGTIAIAGLLIYLQEPSKKDYLTWEEYQNLIKIYNQKIQYIKTNCDIDKRCIKDNGEPKVIFQNIKTKEDLVGKLNEWIKTEDSVYIK